VRTTVLKRARIPSHAFSDADRLLARPAAQIPIELSTRHDRPSVPPRDFVPWRFSAAGSRSAWLDRRCRRPKTCTFADGATGAKGTPAPKAEAANPARHPIPSQPPAPASAPRQGAGLGGCRGPEPYKR
jgi:hypothetical protein